MKTKRYDVMAKKETNREQNGLIRQEEKRRI
jgi:hypothetical protein